jgi:biotin synthase
MEIAGNGCDMKEWRLLDTPPMTAAGNMALDEVLLELKGRGRTHLLSFFPEPRSRMADHPRPSMAHCRRAQVARHLIDYGLSRADRFVYTPEERIADYGIDPAGLERIVGTGQPFRTNGCEGHDGEVACNRRYADSRPGPNQRNYPLAPNIEDLERIRL